MRIIAKNKALISLLAVACGAGIGVASVGIALAVSNNNTNGNAPKTQQAEVLNMFENIKGCTFEPMVTSPKETFQEYTGVKVTAAAGQRSAFRYNGIFNLREGGDFIRYLFLPETMGTADLTDLVITLTDVYDENKYLTIKVVDGETYRSYMSSFIVCSESGKYEGFGYQFNETTQSAGTACTGSWRGIENLKPGLWEQTVFYYDVEEHQLRNRYQRPTTGYNPEADTGYTYELDRLLFDFDDKRYLGENVFEGFTSDEVYITVEMEAAMNPGSLLVTMLAGVDTSGETIDSRPSQVTVDYAGYDKNNLPVGIAGKGYSYPIFDAVAYSPQDGIYEVDDVSVRYGGSIVKVENGRFATEEEGTYQILYTATSKNGNKAYKTVEVQVRSQEEISCNYVFPSEIPDVVYVGKDKVYLPDGKVLGGSGNVTVKSSLFIGDEEVEILESGKGRYFIPTVKEGAETTYVFRCNVVDITGKDNLFEKNIVVKLPTAPVIEDVTVPKAVRVGYETKFAIPTAYTIAQDGTKTDVPVTMTVNGTACENGVYSPTNAGTLNVVFKAGETETSYKVEALARPTSENGNNWYFLPNNFTFDEASDTRISFVKGEGEGTFDFANLVSADGFSFSFDVEKNKIPEVKITITDGVNPNQQVDFYVRDHLGTPMLYAGDISLGGLSGSLVAESTALIGFSYDNDGYLLVSNGNNIGKVEYYANGEFFEGFTSGGVYLTVTVNGETNARFDLAEVNGHPFTMDVEDFKRPTISFEQSVTTQRSVNKGDKFTVYKARGWDVFSAVSQVMVTVKSPSGEIVYTGSCEQDFELTANEYGSYDITYVVRDTEGWDQKYYYKVNSVDVTPPVITGEYTFKKYYKVGETVTLPEIEATDDSGKVQRYHFIITPLGEWRVIVEGNKYTFPEAGTYRICLAAMDTSMNKTYIEYEVFVG